MGSAFVSIVTQPATVISGPDAAADAVARKFAAAWPLGHAQADQWRSALGPLCTHQLNGLLSGTDPATLPRTATLGAPRLTGHDTTSLTYSATADFGAMTITVVKQDQEWKVATFDTGTDPQPPQPATTP